MKVFSGSIAILAISFFQVNSVKAEVVRPFNIYDYKLCHGSNDLSYTIFYNNNIDDNIDDNIHYKIIVYRKSEKEIIFSSEMKVYGIPTLMNKKTELVWRGTGLTIKTPHSHMRAGWEKTDNHSNPYILSTSKELMRDKDKYFMPIVVTWDGEYDEDTLTLFREGDRYYDEEEVELRCHKSMGKSPAGIKFTDSRTSHHSGPSGIQ